MKIIKEVYSDVLNKNIQITKPWNTEMYNHNDEVANIMKKEIIFQINLAEELDDFDTLNELMVLSGGIKYGDTYTLGELWEDCLTEVERVENYWLNEEWDYAVEKGYVKKINEKFLGY
tara:strand:- start:594 stop:947 length:354 start_codon:yes stop_codon:yes gene_type:complete